MKQLHFSKLALAAVCFAASTAAFAGIIYDNPASIGLELTGGWFNNTLDGSSYTIAAANNIATPSTGALLSVDPEDDFGGAIGLFYKVANSPYVFNVTWWGVNSDADDSASGTVGVTKAPATWGFDFATAAGTETDYHASILNFYMGATFRPDCNVTFVPQLGISYFRTASSQSTVYAGDDIPVGQIVNVDESSRFRGWGPSVRADLDYRLFKDFSLFGNVSYAALVGNVDSSYNAVRNGADPANGDNASAISLEDHDTIVNLIQSELGFSYRFCPRYDGKIKIGYSIAKAFDTSEYGRYADDTADTLFLTSMNNTGFQGFFARLSAGFDL